MQYEEINTLITELNSKKVRLHCKRAVAYVLKIGYDKNNNKMDTLRKMRTQFTSDFSTMTEESLILVMGGASLQMAATGSCGSTGSSSSCDNTAICTCCQPEPIKRPPSGPSKSLDEL